MLMKLCVVWLWGLFSSSIWAATHHPQVFLKEIEHSAKPEEEIYKHFCSNCHASHPMIPLGAPCLGDAKAWQLRMAKGKKQLLEHTLNGYRLMPARGGCFECSDAQLEAVVDWMISKR